MRYLGRKHLRSAVETRLRIPLLQKERECAISEQLLCCCWCQ